MELTKNQVKLFVVVSATLTMTLITEQCHAGTSNVKAAEAISSAIIYQEKCTGIAPPNAKLERIVRAMMNSGMTAKEYETGANKAIADISRMYPGRARPPQDICDAATKVYNEVLGSL